MPDANASPNPKGNGSGGSQPTYVAIAIAFLGVVSSLGTAYLTAHNTASNTAATVKKDAQDITQKAIANFEFDRRAGAAIVGEIRAFAFGGAYKSPAIVRLRASGWVECDGTAISRTEYPRLYDVLREEKPWGDVAGQPRIPDLRGVFLRGWFHGSVPGELKQEVAMRTASNRGGAEGNNVGSFQKDQNTISGPFRKLPKNNARVWRSNQPEGDGWFFEAYLPYVEDKPIYPETKRETAPRNVLVMYCIYTGASDQEP